MDRRSFLANMLKAGAATAVAGSVSLVPEAESNELARIADFTSGTLRRSFDESWFFEFESEKSFDISGRKELIIEIGDQTFSLRSPATIATTDLVGGVKLYRIRGTGWKRLKGKDRDHLLEG